MVAGIQLDDARPFWHTSPPYTEKLYPAIAVADLTEVRIAATLTREELTLRISREDGEEIFAVTERLPVWFRSGRGIPAFAYWGVGTGTHGTLEVRDISVW